MDTMKPSVGRSDVLIEVDLGPRARGWFTTRCAPGAEIHSHDLPVSRYPDFNLATHVDDIREAVEARRDLLERFTHTPVAWMNQTHSCDLAPACTTQVANADALILDLHGTHRDAANAAGVLVADCVPVLLATTDGRLGAVIHAGRRGMLGGIVMRALEVLAARGGGADMLHAAVGPSICPLCYEVPEAMRDEAGGIEPASFATTRQGTPSIDVAAGVIAQLRRSGVEDVDHVAICTREDERFYSYRRDPYTGRQAGVVCLSQD